MDNTILFAINNCNNIFIDHVMLRASGTWTWSLMALAILLLIIKDHSFKQTVLLFLGIVLCILFADQVTSTLIKPMVERLRPCQDPHIMYQLRSIGGVGRGYSFPSSHAANNFAVITYLSLVFRHKITIILLYLWALLVCYSRVYLAMHFPSDVLAGALIGFLIGALVYGMVLLTQKRLMPSQMTYYSDAYTKTGYNVNDMYLLVSAIALTFLYVLV